MSVRVCVYAILVGGLWSLGGCGSASTEIPPAGPLTVEEWQDLDPSEKYDPATFDRLKLNDPKLNSEQEWEQFMRKVVIPERRVDLPDSIPRMSA